MTLRLALLCLLLPITIAWAERPERPNMVLMMADDMGIGDTSAHLGVRFESKLAPVARTIRTPNLERFRPSARLFTHAHAAASMCSSTRYSLLTGRFAHRAYLKKQGWLPHGPNPPMIQRALTTLPEMLQAQGYHTGIIGKYHVGMSFDNGRGEPSTALDHSDLDFPKAFLDGPTHHGFHEYFGVPGNTEDGMDTAPRIYLRNDRWTFTDRSRMPVIGMNRRAGMILTHPDWDLRDIGPAYLRESLAFLERRAAHKLPFFLYVVPNANHQQLHAGGRYAVPDEIGGVPIKGRARMTDGSVAGDRADMVLENDVLFGKLLDRLRSTDDPRWPGHKLIENTMVIFTSDNGPNEGEQESPNEMAGGLRGKKAKIWEGGLRVPFMVSWPAGPIEADSTCDSILSLSDLFATLARVVDYKLTPHEAQDSHDCWDHWTGAAKGPDERPRLFFCHLGKPYLNDALALRVGSQKVLIDGGLAMPWASGGQRGDAVPIAHYDLAVNPLELGDRFDGEPPEFAKQLAARALELHNRGYAREIERPAGPGALVLDPGWHRLRNDLDGEIGFTFRVQEPQTVSALSLWDDHKSDRAFADPLAVPTHAEGEMPASDAEDGRGLDAQHSVRLLVREGRGWWALRRVRFTPENPGALRDSFRELPIGELRLEPGQTYALLQSTRANDGDLFHDPASFDGLSPLVHPKVVIEQSVFVRGEMSEMEALPTFIEPMPGFSRHRLPVGPNLRLE